MQAVRLITEKQADRIITKYGKWIHEVSEKYGIPAAVIKAVLFKEMTEIDLLDVFADFAVFLHLKDDSSTGYGQIFGHVGLNAINNAVDKGLASYRSLGISAGRRLDPKDRRDVRAVWKKLWLEPKANIEISALNLICCAEEMTGRVSFGDYSGHEIKLLLTRYNANVRHVTQYGETAYRHYLRYGGNDGNDTAGKG